MILFVPLFSSNALGQEKSQSTNQAVQIVKQIRIQGNKKIESEAIKLRLKTKEGTAFNQNLIREDIDSIFKAGYFYDIQVDKTIEQGQIVLTYIVKEKPSITEIVFEGNVELKDEEVSEAAGIKPYEILNVGKINEAVEKIQKLYEDKGFFLARIEKQIEDIQKDEKVRLKFTIEENEKVRVKKITFLGNRNLKDTVLKDRLATKEGGFWSFMSGHGQYKQEAFDKDLQILRFLYYNEGYVQVKIDRPQVYVTPDKKGIYITIRIDEGEQFFVGNISFAGDLLYSDAELLEAMSIDDSKVFSVDKLQRDISELTAKCGDLGYAFANVMPRTTYREKDRKVDVVFEFDKGQKVYFGEINVQGNTKTRDKVVRRELKIREGELYHETRKRESIEGVQRLGYFEEVNFKTSTSPEKSDVLNIDIVVKERTTGSIQLGAGYSSSEHFTLTGQVNQANFLGKGQKLGASLNHSSRGSFYNFKFTEPYFMDSTWLLGFDIYHSESGRSEFNEKRLGSGVQFGHPLWENVNGYVRYKYEKSTLSPIVVNDMDLTDRALFPLESAAGLTSSITGTIDYDNRNDRFAPSKGIYSSLNIEYAGLGGDLKFTKGTSTFRYYKKVFWEVVLRNNISYGLITSNDPDKAPPFNELFLLGGPYSLRGYYNMTIGKRVKSDKTYDALISKGYPAEEAQRRSMKPYGGKQQLYYSAELEFPMINEAGIKGVVFFDIGQAEDQIRGNDFLSDVGFGLRWFSPIGPLRFEWGFPLDYDPLYHEPVVFDFSIGSPF